MCSQDISVCDNGGQEYANFDEVGLDHKDRDSRFVFWRAWRDGWIYLLESASGGLIRGQTSKIGKLLLLSGWISNFFFFFLMAWNILLTYVWNFFCIIFRELSVSFFLSALKIQTSGFRFPDIFSKQNDAIPWVFCCQPTGFQVWVAAETGRVCYTEADVAKTKVWNG